MKNKFGKRFLSLVMCICMLMTSVFVLPISADESTPTLTISDATVCAGGSFTVYVTASNNPGISAFTLSIDYDTEALTLTDVVVNPTLGGQSSYTKKVVWISSKDVAYNGTILTLSFTANETADVNDYPVSVSYTPGDICNYNEEDINFEIVPGTVSVVDIVPGDINGDGTVNSKDLNRMMRYLSGDDVYVVEQALDTNGDSAVNNKDLIRLMKYIAGADVDIYPLPKACKHVMDAVSALEPTCTLDGHSAYWYCTVCRKYFSDENGKNEIEYEDTVIAATGHTVVIDEAVPPTYESTGLTEGSHCSVCNSVLIKQEIISKLEAEQYSIVYNIANGDTYLSSLEIENPNQNYYYSPNGLTLKNVSVPGYTFIGWYDLPAGENAENIKKIAVGEKGDIELYAHWQKIEYTIQFKSDLLPADEIKYTVDKGATLPSLQLDGYIFAGWSDENGDILKTVPTGVIGNKIYTANWISERNQAWTKTKLDAPIIIEDGENNTILFTYEIGEIRNVPLYVIEDFGKINSGGVSKTVTKTFSKTVSEALMESYTNTVAKATTESYGWTLSSDWSDCTSIDETWAKENGMTSEEANSYCKSDSSGWYISKGNSGSKTTVTLDTKDNYNLETATKNAKLNGSGTSTSSTTVDAKLSVGLEAEASFGIANVKENISGEMGSSEKRENSSTAGYEVGGEKENQGGYVSHTGTQSTSNSNWNNESGRNGSSTISNSASVSKAVSERISNMYGYGKSYISNSGESSSQGLTSSSSDADTYSNSVTYSTAISESETVTYTTTNTMTGYHRWIMAGTAHVFAIVGYDISTKSFFVNTYSVMDDEMHQYEDYSYSYSSYDDNQNGQISFEIPTEVTDYVAGRVCETQGLEIDRNGKITNYTGSADYIIIPEYKVIDNLDGTTNVIKVTGLSEDAFKGNTDIVAVELSDFIRSVPDNAFKNCAALQYTYANSVTEIGSNAFAGCTLLKSASIGDGVVSIGSNAFDGVNTFTVNAANVSIVDSAVNSGASNITVTISDKCELVDNKSLVISNTTDSFIFNGMGRTYTNLFIESDASKTVINRTKLVSTSKAPLKISSDALELNQTTITAPGIALVSTSDTCKIGLYGETFISSNSDNSLLCKNIVFSQLKDDFYSRLNVDGNVLICGEIVDDKYLNCSDSIIKISQDEFDKYAKGSFIISFNANGGSVPLNEKLAYCGSAIGELPVPTKQYYTFNGWYTDPYEGTEVTAESVINVVENITVYAHWTENTYTLSFNPNGGTVAESSRTVSCGTAIGSLPTPIKDYYEFLYWTNDISGNVPVTSTSAFTSDTTLYAQWQQKPISSYWVTSSSVPSGAQIVDRKYTYDLTSYTTSSYSTLSGWNLYNTTSAWSDYGAWSDWSDSAYYASDSRQIETQQVVASYNYKTVYHYFWYAKDSSTGLTSYQPTTTYGKNRYTIALDSPISGTDGTNAGGTRYKYWYSSSNYKIVYADSPYTTQEVVSTNYKTQYRCRDRYLIYTYYFYKVDSMESTAYPSGDNISNIVEWVKYREK